MQDVPALPASKTLARCFKSLRRSGAHPAHLGQAVHPGHGLNHALSALLAAQHCTLTGRPGELQGLSLHAWASKPCQGQGGVLRERHFTMQYQMSCLRGGSPQCPAAPHGASRGPAGASIEAVSACLLHATCWCTALDFKPKERGQLRGTTACAAGHAQAGKAEQ